jgi:hypothetical protein
MNPQSTAALIIDHLGGRNFLASVGARNFAIDDTHLSFTFVHDNPKGIHSVTISIEPDGSFKMACYGRIMPGTLHAPTLGTEKIAISENLAAVLGKLTGIDALQHRHL